MPYALGIQDGLQSDKTVLARLCKTEQRRAMDIPVILKQLDGDHRGHSGTG